MILYNTDYQKHKLLVRQKYHQSMKNVDSVTHDMSIGQVTPPDTVYQSKAAELADMRTTLSKSIGCHAVNSGNVNNSKS